MCLLLVVLSSFYIGQLPEIALDPASYLSTILDSVNIQNARRQRLWCLFGSHKLVLYQQQLEKNNRLDRVTASIGALFLCNRSQWTRPMSRADLKVGLLTWCGVLFYWIPNSSFLVGPRLKGWKIIKGRKERGVIQTVTQSKLQHFAEISRNSMKFLCFFCWPLAVPSKQLYIGHVLTCSMWGGGGIKEPRQRQGLINHGKCWSIKLRRVYHVISTGFPWCFNSNIGFVYGFVII